MNIISDPIIDRRLNGKNKSIGNRERFLRRHKGQIQEAVKRAVGSSGGDKIQDVGKSRNITVKGTKEYHFGHGQGGKREMVHPGNKEYVRGDRIKRPEGGGGQGKGSNASDSGEGEDDFTFGLTKEEFMEVFFNDLALPNLARTILTDTTETRLKTAGYSSSGSPESMHPVRTMRTAMGRRIALGGRAPSEERIKELEDEKQKFTDLFNALMETELDSDKGKKLLEEIAIRDRVLARTGRAPYLDPIDLRYRNKTRVPVPQTSAKMMCLMDVSGSMDEERKDLAKRYYILLYLFLSRHYEKVELIFIRHHTAAKVCDEEEFFHGKETGGTVVSSALKLALDLIKTKYPPSQHNIYIAQASDGDNWQHDNPTCDDLIRNELLPLVKYFAYLQVAETEQPLWDTYQAIQKDHPQYFRAQKATSPDQIYPVFRKFFEKDSFVSRMPAPAP